MKFATTFAIIASLVAQCIGQELKKGFTLQILHSSDNESNFQDVNTLEEKIIFYSAISNGLEMLGKKKRWATLHLAAGDHTIPGPFYRASSEVETFGTGDAGGKNGIADILFYNTIGFDANGMGNHEFDGGIDEFAEMLAVANYPFLAANLDFSNVVLEPDTTPIKIVDDAGPCEDAAGAVSKSCFITVKENRGGIKIGLIGRAPADFFNIIEDPDENIPGLDFVGGRDENNDPLESAVGQVLEQVDLLTEAGCIVIILLDHAQDFTNDPLAVENLYGIDIIITAGSTGFFAQTSNFGPFNLLREGDEPDESYPVAAVDSEGNPVLLVESDELWNYIGHLVVDFDRNGVIKTWDGRSGPIATTQEAVDLLADVLGVHLSEDPDVRTILDDLQAANIITDGFTEIGTTEIPLNGDRSDVRSRETNLGRLAADSSIWGAEQEGFAPVIALKNGGGIRAPIIGPTIVRLGIETALAFDNTLTIVELTATQLLAAMENAYSRVPDLDGRFAQLAGLTVTYDPSNPGIENEGEVTIPSRVTQLSLVDGTEIVSDGALVAPTGATYVMATNSFLATGGDGYVSIAAGNILGETGLGEQQILEDYITTVLGGTVVIEDPPSPAFIIEE